MEILRTNAARVALTKRLALLVAFVALAIYLSTREPGDDAAGDAFNGGFFLALIPWALALFAGGELVRWVRHGAHRTRTAREVDAGFGLHREPARRLPGPALEDVLANLRFIASAVAGVVVMIIVLLPAGWWSSASGTLRSALEALPLGSAVATTPGDHGNPALISTLAAAAVAIAIWGTSRWRLRSVRSYIDGEITFAQLFVVGMVHTLAIFAGLTLIPVLGVIAAGADLRQEPAHTFTGPVWPVLVAGCWAAFTYAGLRRLYREEAERS
jgi:hypothetical protein